MSTARKQAKPATRATHPARPAKAPKTVADTHNRIAKRFPKVLAELAK